MNRREAIRTMAGAATLALPAARASIEPEITNIKPQNGATPATSAHLAHCQLGYRPDSPKQITLVAERGEAAAIPSHVPFYVRRLFDRIPRERVEPAAWSGNYFRWPFDIASGKLKPSEGKILKQGEVVRHDTRWGTVWQGDLGDFEKEGIYQVETDYGCTFPITIRSDIYERIHRTFLNFLHCQRSGFEVPGIRRAEHLDDAILDTTRQQIAAAGGWYDAGDFRKWLFLTQPNIAALSSLARRGHRGLRGDAIEEIRWGNQYFHAMMAPDGQLWEDVAGGTFKAGLDMDKDWWFENHPGCNANNSGGVYTDNIPRTGDERLIRTTYNPAVQFLFVRTQCQAAGLLPPGESASCISLAERSWKYGRGRGHDRRTLFVAEELWSGLELLASGSKACTKEDIRALTHELLGRQDQGGGGLEGYFMEKDGIDAFRSIAMSCEPAFALLRLAEVAPAGLEGEVSAARTALFRYLDGYILADSSSNPFGIGPYGVYLSPILPKDQIYRDAGRGRGVRTFIHPFNQQQIAHGTASVVMHQAALCARSAGLAGIRRWRVASERMMQWAFGHNLEGFSLHSGIGYRHITPFSAYVAQVPDAMSIGHNGRPDDSPYLETSPLVEWCTQEIWDVPHGYALEAALWL
jgi:Glycosyl hydrolase family 9